MRINKLVLIDVPAFKEIKPNFIKILQSNILSFLTLNILPTNIIAKHTIKTTFYDLEKSKRKHFERYNYFFKIRGINNSMKKLASQITPDNINEIEDCLELINNKVLIIWGRNDDLIPIYNGIKLHSKIKRSLFKVIEKCGHVPHEEKPSEAYQIIKNFLLS